jgi:hypothetical protein
MIAARISAWVAVWLSTRGSVFIRTPNRTTPRSDSPGHRP